MNAERARVETDRRSFDRYETPPHYVDALVDHIGVDLDVVYEPCVGQCAIPSRLRDRGWTGKLWTNDLDRRVKADWHQDARKPKAWVLKKDVWCITNPPFKHEQAILEQALKHHNNVAFLARLSFLEPTKSRTGFWIDCCSACEVIVLSRYSFRNNSRGVRGSDNQTCCWLIWRDQPLPDRAQFMIDGRRLS